MRKNILFMFIMALGLGSAGAKPKADEALSGIREIPNLLQKLKETTLEDERVQMDKAIHDAVISVDLSNKKVVRELEPLILQIRSAMDAGLDRSNIAGQDTWLGSAIHYFYRERLKVSVDVSTSDWLDGETASLTGSHISIYPNKILLHEGSKTTVLFESEGIHEAVISPDGRTVAAFRVNDPESSQAEIWVIRGKNHKQKKIITWASCQTVLLSEKGNRLFFQEVPAAPKGESPLYSISVRGGRPKKIGEGRLLETLIMKGKYKGMLVVYKNKPHPLGIADLECPEVITDSGKEVGRIRGEMCR